ncbi:hypothetical protein NH340_JMT06254 [Sarcoptes scabiei]|nr:hypothetical protein NH340_JMT06254 [Sarcoptes scabiei]
MENNKLKMSLRKVKGNLDRIFDKNLTDLVRGIRNNKDNEAKYITQCIEEIKEELRHDSLFVKANAISKLTYLQMLGYDISWAAFNIIEVMSSTKFSHKRIGYLAASQSFHENTEVMMLTTNMIRKDLNSQNIYDAGCAMSGLACFVTADISRDLANDVLTLLSSTKPYLRKKAILLLYKIFLKFPDALKPAFSRLKEKLEDPDPGVQSAAVNVICELARKNPKNYLSLAPIFFKLMTNSTNNWMLIKIIKLFGALTPLEPRLGKKLIEPLTNLIHSTSAMSLLYECINTVIAVLISISSGLPNHNASIQLCVQKLRILIEDSDQNLKYLGLLAMNRILKTHPKSVQTHKDLVLNCLDDKDESIRLRALDLLHGMVTKKNLMDVVQKLVKNVTEGQIGNKFRDELISKIIEICSQNDYQYIANFEWYLSVLIELARVEGGTIHGVLIAQQILDVSIRVDAIRLFATEQMYILLENSPLFQNNSTSEVLFAAAWICGEFVDFLPDKAEALKNLLTNYAFPPHIVAVFIQNASKIFSKIAVDPDFDSVELIKICDWVQGSLKSLLNNPNLEIQERATTLYEIISIVKSIKNEPNAKQQQKSLMCDENESSNLEEESNEENKILTDLNQFFYAYPLNPVAAKAQRKVPIPIGLDLDVPFDMSESDSDSIDYDDNYEKIVHLIDDEDNQQTEESSEEESLRKQKLEEERARQAATRKFEQANNPNYLNGDKKKKISTVKNEKKNMETDILGPEKKENLDNCSQKSKKFSIPGLASSEKYLKQMQTTKEKNRKRTKAKSKQKGKSTKEEKKSSEIDEEDEDDGLDSNENIAIRALEMPEGADLNENDINDEEDDDFSLLAKTDPHRALAKVNLNDDDDRRTKSNKSSKTEKNHSMDNSYEKDDRKKKSKKKNTKSKKDILMFGERSTLIDDSMGSARTKKIKTKKISMENEGDGDQAVIKTNKTKNFADQSVKKRKTKKTPNKIDNNVEGVLLMMDETLKFDQNDPIEKKSVKKVVSKTRMESSKNREEYEETLDDNL